MNQRLKEKIGKSVEDFVLNGPFFMDFGNYKGKKYVENGQMYKLKGYGLDPQEVEIVFPLNEIKKFLFQKEYEIDSEEVFPHKFNDFKFSSIFQRKKKCATMSDVKLVGLKLPKIKDSDLVKILRNYVFLDEKKGIVSSYINKSNKNKTFYHGFNGKVKKIAIENLAKKGRLLNFFYSNISITTDPRYAKNFGEIVLEFELEKYQKSKIIELKKFQNEIKKRKITDSDELTSWKGNVYLGYNKYPFFVLNDSNIQKDVIYGKKYKFKEFTNGYSVKEFSELNLNHLSKEDQRKLIFFYGYRLFPDLNARGIITDSLEIRMSFNDTIISANALESIYTTHEGVKLFKEMGVIKEQGEKIFFITPDKNIPIYSTRNIPRKINGINRERYQKEIV